MIRINYLPSPVRPPRPDAATCTLVAGVLSMVLGCGVQELRVHGADAARVERMARAQRATAALDRMVRLRADIARLQHLNAEISAGHRRPDSVAGVARLGNRLPASAWISSIRSERGVYTVEGHARSVQAVAATLRSFGALPNASGARLLSARRDANADLIAYAIVVQDAP